MSILWSRDGVGGPVEPHCEYKGFYPGSALDQISEMDPEGWDYQMTEAEYRHAREQFRQRVIDQYGQESLEQLQLPGAGIRRVEVVTDIRRDEHGGGDAPVG